MFVVCFATGELVVRQGKLGVELGLERESVCV